MANDSLIEKLLSNTVLRIHPQHFVITYLPLSYLPNLKSKVTNFDAAFWSLSIEEDATTLILPESYWTEIAAQFPLAQTHDEYRIITLDTPFSVENSQYLTAILNILSTENLSPNILSGFSRKHIIIKNRDFIRTIEILNNVIETNQ